MRRLVGLYALALLFLGSSGCVVALGNKGSNRGPRDRQAVVIDGEVYVVDVNRGTAMRLPSDAVQRADDFVERVHADDDCDHHH